MAGVNGHVNISWPMLGLFGAFVAAVITVAIRLGGVETHVLINTDRLSIAEIREREHLVQISIVKSRQEMNEQRIRDIELHDIKTREFEAELNRQLADITAQVKVHLLNK